ncbi:lysozyme inhibitor LprI family protein [Roseateles sp. BYS78W]|uniref:Lysozyme inhibitor LprI family protein n=1 Tax=Pelomonas candidula TaxID=3299025 RepID=A0ABW7HHM8_9BURK
MTTQHRAVAALLALLSCASASAASFDCRQARSPMEQAICGNAVLSTLDERMARSYQRALLVLSPAGAAALKASQRSWLRYVQKVCTPAQDAQPRPAGEACLMNELNSRIRGLDQAGVKLGALVLTHVDQYATHPAPAGDDTGSPGRVVTRHVGRLQFDGPVTPAVQAWNRAQTPPTPPAAPRDSDDDESADTDSDTLIGCASDKLLSVQATSYFYAHGTPHGSGGHATTTTLLQAGMRAMTAADLFAPQADWKTRLPTLFWQAHLRQPNALKTAEAEQAIRAAAADETRWLITPTGLQVSMEIYEAGGYAETPVPITVTWDMLKPLLIDKSAPACDFSSLGGQ